MPHAVTHKLHLSLRQAPVWLAFLLATPLLAQPAPRARPPSIVYSAHDPAAIKDYRANPAVVRAMVNRLVLAVTGQSDLNRAWSSLVSPNDKIGIKICAAGGELFTTHRDIVNTVVDGLVAAGHSRNRIIVWDRSLGGIKEAGYREEGEGYQLKSIAPRDGYDPKVIFSAPIAGKLIWGDLEFRSGRGTVPLLSDKEQTSDESHLARIVSSDVTKIINIPVMSDSASNGIVGCLYNVTIPNIDNWRRFTQGSRFGSAAIADLYRHPQIGPKVVLNIMDGLIAEYAGGPQSQPNFAVHHATILASKDPVAIDAMAVRQIEEWRVKAQLSPITPLAAHVQVAAQLGIGSADLIELRKVDR